MSYTHLVPGSSPGACTAIPNASPGRRCGRVVRGQGGFPIPDRRRPRRLDHAGGVLAGIRRRARGGQDRHEVPEPVQEAADDEVGLLLAGRAGGVLRRGEQDPAYGGHGRGHEQDGYENLDQGGAAQLEHSIFSKIYLFVLR